MELEQESRLRSQAPLIALEALLIVLGVVLAYASTAWYESRKEAQAAREAMASIVEEIEENRRAVRSSIEYHMTVRLALVSAMRSGEQPRRSDFPRGYIGPAELVTTAWDLASARGAISTLPYAQVLEVSRLYSEQAGYQETARDVGRMIYGVIFQSGSASILERGPNLLEIIGTFLYQECGLLGHQEEVLASLARSPTDAGALPEPCPAILNRRGAGD